MAQKNTFFFLHRDSSCTVGGDRDQSRDKTYNESDTQERQQISVTQENIRDSISKHSLQVYKHALQDIIK